MNKITAVIIMIVFLSLYGCAKNPNIISSNQTVKIGFLGPMSGDLGNTGKIMSQSVIIAIDEFNAEAGKNGLHAELIIKNAGTDAKEGVVNMQKLAEDDLIVGLIGAFTSSVSLAIAPIAEKNKIVMISPASTHKDLPDKGEFIFRNIMSDSLQAVVFAKYLKEVEKVKTVGILYMKNDYSFALAMDFIGQYEKAGGKVIALESGRDGDKDFITQLRKIKSQKPDAIFIPNYYTENAVILDQMKQIGFKAKIYSSDAFANSQIFELAGELTDGVVFTQEAEQPSGKKREEFEAKYNAKWGRKPGAQSFNEVKEYYDGSVYWGAKPDSFCLKSYDAAKIILNAIRAASVKGTDGKVTIDRNKMREIVASTKNYDGVSGKITFTANGDLVANIGIYTVKSRQYKQVKVYKIDGDKLVRIK